MAKRPARARPADRTPTPPGTAGRTGQLAHQNAELEQLLTASDAARALTMSPENVRRLTRIGVLKACAVTVSPFRPILLYRLADVQALAAKRARPERLPIPSERTGYAENPIAAWRQDVAAHLAHLRADATEALPPPARRSTPPRRR